jgi:hypothetical protein
MKLRNKKTGEIIETGMSFLRVPDRRKTVYKSLEELNEEWEDYEEPKEYWYYDTTKNGIDKITHLEDKEKDKEIGNYFETREEAEKAVEKLKAWKRLEDAGFKFIGKTLDYNADKHFGSVFFEISGDIIDTYGDVIYFNDDFNLLFGGEE